MCGSVCFAFVSMPHGMLAIPPHTAAHFFHPSKYGKNAQSNHRSHRHRQNRICHTHGRAIRLSYNQCRLAPALSRHTHRHSSTYPPRTATRKALFCGNLRTRGILQRSAIRARGCGAHHQTIPSARHPSNVRRFNAIYRCRVQGHRRHTYSRQ